GPGGGGDGGAGTVDASLDAGVECPAPAAGELGVTCVDNDECNSEGSANDGRCLGGESNPFRGVTWPSDGFCTRICDPDAPDNCGADSICMEQEGFPNGLCMPLCCEGIGCAATFACNTRPFGTIEAAMNVCIPGDQAAT